MIACFVIPDLVATLERGHAGKPIVLMSAAGSVQGVSRVAAGAGVRPGMRVGQAQSLCPAARLIDFQESRYAEFVEAVQAALRQFTTHIELLPGFWETGRRARRGHSEWHPSAAIFYLNLGRLKGQDGLVLADQMTRLMHQQFSAQSCIGLGRGKFPAFVAARYTRPQQPKLIYPGDEAAFLAPLPVSLLPLGKELSRRLGLLGLRTLGDLAALPVGSVTTQLGKGGRFLHQLAQGRDTRPVIVQPQKPSYTLTQPFDGVVEDRSVIEAALRQLAYQIEGHLAESGYATHALRLQVADDVGEICKVEAVLREPASNSRYLGRVLIRLFSKLELSSGVTELEVTARDLAPVVWRQLDLFGAAQTGSSRLSELVEALTTRFGSETLYQVNPDDAGHWLVERRFTIEQIEVV